MICKFGAYVAPIVVWIMLLGGEAFACSCPDFAENTLANRVNAALKQADAVFTGEVITVSEKPGPYPYRHLEVEVSLTSVWKGDLTRTLTISTGRNGAACGVSFEKGETYLVYASNSTWYSSEGSLTAGLCGRTRRISKATDDLLLLGEPKKVFQPLGKP